MDSNVAHAAVQDDLPAISGPRLDAAALLVVAGVFLAGFLIVGLRANAPAIDDWVYAWSVEHFVATGRLQVLEFSAIYPVTQVLWGALFVSMAGFSFVALRASTAVLAMLGCSAVYLTLRELECRRSTALLGALALAFHPVYFALSFSFMTEVPFVSLSTLSLYCYVRGLRRRRAGPVWAGGLLAVAAFLVRPLAIVLPWTLLPAVILDPARKGAIRRAVVPALAALGCMAVLQAVLPRMLGPLDWADVRRESLRWWFVVPWADYGRWTLGLLTVSVFPLAPLFLPYSTRRSRLLAVGAIAVCVAALSWVAVGGLETPLPDWQTWSLQEFSARSLLGGDLESSAWSLRIAPAIKVLGLVTLSGAILIGLGHWAWRLGPGRAELIVVSSAVLNIAAIHVLWLYNDRYYVVLAPTLAIAGARALDRDRRLKWMAAALLVVWAAVDVTGTRDMLAFNDASARVVRELEGFGIPPWQIDAGYTLNGWRLYAHPEHLPAGADRRYDVPYVTSKATTAYSVRNSPLAGAQVVRVVPLPHVTWEATRKLYVVSRPQ